MNQTTKIAVALIVAAGISTMVYALPEQRAMAHLRLSPDPSDLSDADVIPFGPHNPAVGPNNDPPPPGAGPPFGPNCVGCISTQNLANGAVMTPKIAPGAVSINTEEFTSPNVVVQPNTSGVATVQCPSGSVVTGGGYVIDHNLPVQGNRQPGVGPNGWEVLVFNTLSEPIRMNALATCATIHP